MESNNCNMTKIQMVKPCFSIDLSDNIFAIGSCFSSEISKYLIRKGIEVSSNPFGTIYNSYSIKKCLDIIINKKEFKKEDLIFEKGKYFSFFHSTGFDSKNEDFTFNKINSNIIKNYEILKNSSIFILTLGTSVVYKEKKNGEIVANCHKIAESYFEKRILSVQENIEYINDSIYNIKKINRNAKVILTLSPIRHTPQNLSENQYSKSILRVAIENVINNIDIFYFPSYEMVMDEFRNYKFYKNDGVHLKKNTVERIMDVFENVYFSESLRSYLKTFSGCKKIRKHKPFSPDSKEYFELLKKNILTLINLGNKKKSLLIEKEILICAKRLISLFYLNSELSDFFSSNLIDYTNLKDFLVNSLKIYRNENIDNLNLEYVNEFYKNFDNYKSMILTRYYVNVKDFDKLMENL
jgi:hypothetical protein